MLKKHRNMICGHSFEDHNWKLIYHCRHIQNINCKRMNNRKMNDNYTICRICYCSSVIRKSGLEKHMKKHTDRCSCPIKGCTRKYYNIKLLNYHMKEKHTINDYLFRKEKSKAIFF